MMKDKAVYVRITSRLMDMLQADLSIGPNWLTASTRRPFTARAMLAHLLHHTLRLTPEQAATVIGTFRHATPTDVLALSAYAAALDGHWRTARRSFQRRTTILAALARVPARHEDTFCPMVPLHALSPAVQNIVRNELCGNADPLHGALPMMHPADTLPRMDRHPRRRPHRVPRRLHHHRCAGRAIPVQAGHLPRHLRPR